MAETARIQEISADGREPAKESTDQDPYEGPGRILWNFLKSVRLGVVLMAGLAAVSIIGTFIPQNQPEDAYKDAFGDAWTRLLSGLDLFDMYHSSWFRLLLALLVANIVVCSIDRFRAQRKIIFTQNPHFLPERFRKQENRQSLISPASPRELAGRFAHHARRSFSVVGTEQRGKTTYVYAERGRWTRLGVYIVHASVVLLALGAMMGSFFGFDGYMKIAEGETASQCFERSTGKPLALPFSVSCEKFSVSFNDNGSPKEYRSSLALSSGGRTLVKKDVLVNHPLRYRGISLFQSSYGKMPPNRITLALTPSGGDAPLTRTLSVGESSTLPGKRGVLTLKSIADSYAFGNRELGETAILVLQKPGAKAVEVAVPFRFPAFDKMRRGEFALSVKEYESPYYTGLSVSRDPGVPLVYLGFLVLIAGLFITFFLSHQRVLVELSENKSGTRVAVSGIANRNEPGVDERVKRIAALLSAPAGA
ncbi:MAG: cytochrome c biogenesis protein ResB [Thermodesulfobacteriota bacterium]